MNVNRNINHMRDCDARLDERDQECDSMPDCDAGLDGCKQNCDSTFDSDAGLDVRNVIPP